MNHIVTFNDSCSIYIFTITVGKALIEIKISKCLCSIGFYVHNRVLIYIFNVKPKDVSELSKMKTK